MYIPLPPPFGKNRREGQGSVRPLSVEIGPLKRNGHAKPSGSFVRHFVFLLNRRPRWGALHSIIGRCPHEPNNSSVVTGYESETVRHILLLARLSQYSGYQTPDQRYFLACGEILRPHSDTSLTYSECFLVGRKQWLVRNWKPGMRSLWQSGNLPSFFLAGLLVVISKITKR